MCALVDFSYIRDPGPDYFNKPNKRRTTARNCHRYDIWTNNFVTGFGTDVVCIFDGFFITDCSSSRLFGEYLENIRGMGIVQHWMLIWMGDC
jgi:hypothetical protein